MDRKWNQTQPAVISVTDGEPSKWWAWGLALGIAIMTILGAFGSIVNVLMPYDIFLADWNPEDPGIFPENGTSDEQEKWNSSNEEWSIHQNVTNLFDELQGGVAQKVCFMGFINGIIAMIACTMLVQRNQNGFKMAGLWILTSTVSQIVMTIQYSNIIGSIYPSDQQWIAAISLGSNIGGAIFCNIFLLGIVLLCSVKHKGDSNIPESGFHNVKINNQL